MEEALHELQTIPGVGKSIALDLYQQGFHRISDLKNADPEDMYKTQCSMQGVPLDRCLLYVFRCAVYFASHKTHDPEKLKWWNWKDKSERLAIRS